MKSFLVLGALLLTGCASTVFESRTDRFGDFSTHGDVTPSEHAPRLYIETAPEGFSIENNVVDYDRARYEYLGRIFVRRNYDNWRLGFVSYNEPWRQYYCPPAVVLTYGLLFTPGVLGLPFPCVYERSGSKSRIEERKKHIAHAAILEGMKIGATHVIFATYTGLEYPQGAGNPAQADNLTAATAVGSQSLMPYMGMTAHAFKRK
jgi:hypothetical protein